MEKITRKEFRNFCRTFTYKFISSECMEKEFSNLTCKDAQVVEVHLHNQLELDLEDWLEAMNIEIED